MIYPIRSRCDKHAQDERRDRHVLPHPLELQMRDDSQLGQQQHDDGSLEDDSEPEEQRQCQVHIFRDPYHWRGDTRAELEQEPQSGRQEHKVGEGCPCEVEEEDKPQEEDDGAPLLPVEQGTDEAVDAEGQHREGSHDAALDGHPDGKTEHLGRSSVDRLSVRGQSIACGGEQIPEYLGAENPCQR